VTLLIIAVALDVPMAPQPPRELGIFLALALGPMLLGHTGMNYALRYLPAYAVNVTVLGEPIGATILAALIPGIAEVPTTATLVGGVLILAGVVLTIRRAVPSSG
jgi:drug/metabolite transporter (DMT)-like permease